ncbi:DUF6531 domain-containing protein [Fervidibacter sacchari]|uniref:DUF6531 domain-containing protein n=1 Tax=Candidatus Fervidibacter sacchari TaxID=1448929 RepID=A0ABT2ESV1_9BACT|nr:DUF6531 domain-containing protein [Candidatus Fervidibacter sacchari]MCS3921048.1 hypothetical protein [Candidatus Fervidibacter sacchari]WKU16594.1 DUF6531 domain-containing protein [Candidatus Fervidibacter sacchari]
MTLFHNSASSSSLQPFGYGWTHSYNWEIQQDSQTSDAIVIRGTGRKHRYTYNAQSGTFTPPAGVLRRISPPSRQNLDAYLQRPDQNEL